MYGLLGLPWWGCILALLGMTYITILSVTIYLHRSQAHRAVDLHPAVSHFFRFWIWISTGMVTKEWAAIHRKHHAKVETPDDPHSPQVQGVWKVVLEGAEMYRKERGNKETMERYGHGTPDDWLEHNVYLRFGSMGIAIMLVADLLLFGTIGISIWAMQMMWIPFFAAGVINGIGHAFGYRNFESPDASRNITPIAFLLGGEELHNNHHTFATSAKFSVKWWEFDMGWLVIRVLQMFGLAHPKRVPPELASQPGKLAVDADTLKAVLTNRFQVMARYSKEVIFPVLQAERQRAGEAGSAMLSRMRTLMIRETSLLDAMGKQRLADALKHYRSLHVVYQFRMRLQQIWARGTATQKELIESLQEWCRQAENTGIEALREFVQHLKTYVPQQQSGAVA